VSAEAVLFYGVLIPWTKLDGWSNVSNLPEDIADFVLKKLGADFVKEHDIFVSVFGDGRANFRRFEPYASVRGAVYAAEALAPADIGRLAMSIDVQWMDSMRAMCQKLGIKESEGSWHLVCYEYEP